MRRVGSAWSTCSRRRHSLRARLPAPSGGTPNDAPMALGWWGVAAVLWIGTGLARAFGGFEKGSFYYLHNHFFWAKMGLFAGILLLELRPMIGLIRWRRLVAHGEVPDARAARAFARISFIQAILVV